MFKGYIQQIMDAGVVGAGGAGFPTHVKINNNAEVVIANGAECEPLLRVDQQVMEFFPEKVLEGLKIVMEISNAKRGVICLKGKYHNAMDSLNRLLPNYENISIMEIGNYYPAGDEQQLVYEVTGRVVPTGGLPIDVGAIVDNVSTLANIADAAENKPVTNKFVTVTGAVSKPVTLNVPIGTPVKRLIELAGGPSGEEGYTLILGGPAMGKVEKDWSAPVTKTLGGVIILPSNHPHIIKKIKPIENEYKLTKSACCQCTNCTAMCPRNALGLDVAPHKVMRAISYGEGAALGNDNGLFSCCDCGLCTYYACSMGLSPSKMVSLVKGGMIKKGIKPVKNVPSNVNPSREYIKVPTHRFIERLGLGSYDVPAPMDTAEIASDRVRIPLKQHIGAPAAAVVKEGDIVEKGSLIGSIQEGKLGANIHASISGIVAGVTPDFIEIKAIG